MNADLSDQTAPKPEPSNRKIWVIIGIASIIFILFIQDALGWFEHGGIFSLVAAVRAVNAKASSVDVDRGAFVGIGIALFSAAACSVCYVFNAPTERRFIAVPIVLVVMGLGFGLGERYGVMITSDFMLSHGYSRCPARDHFQGSGKSVVAFHNYVSSPAGCPGGPPMTPPHRPIVR